MKNIKRISALVLALIMVLALTATAFAADLGGSETGVAGTWTAQDTPIQQDKTINILKEITAFNPDETYVYGPAIEYTYAIASASGTELVQITDETTNHASGVATVFPAALGAADITSGTPSLTGTAANTIAWTNSDILEADTVANGGAANYKKLAIDFSSVVFSKPGVYRYKITENTPAAATMTAAGVTDGTISNIRYLDVYVMRSNVDDTTYDLYTDGSTAAQWIIYGYVCISPQSVATNAGGTTAVTPSTKKTKGFVTETVPDPSDPSANVTNKADEYYTYNLTVTKDLVGDNTMINHQFPFSVAFDTTTNSKGGTFQLIVENTAPSTITTTHSTVAAHTSTVNSAGDGSTGGTSAAIEKIGNAQVLSASNYEVKIADGNTDTGTTTGLVKLIGIPYGVLASVTETNDNVGTTYQASAKEDVTTAAGTTLVAVDVSSSTGTLSTGSPVVASIDNTETATRTVSVATAYGSNVNAAVQFTNTLAIISPTGVAFRVAPYVLMLCAGIALVLITRRRENTEEV